MNGQMTPEPMAIRVAQFVNTLAVADGGAARNSFEVNLALNDLPDVTVQMFWLSGDAAQSISAADPRPAPHVRPLRGRLRMAIAVLRSADVVIIEGFYLWWVPVVAAACRILGVPYVIMPHGVFTDYQRAHSQRKKRLFDTFSGRAVRAHAAALLVATTAEGDELRGFAPDATVAVCGVGTAAAERTAVGPAHAPLRLVSMSRIAPKKRIDVAIRTLSALKERRVDATLVVAGDGESGLVSSLHELAVSEGLTDRVDFVGQIDGDEKTDLLIQADLFLAPSEDENFGIAVAEALAHGLPVVATRRVNAAAPADGVAGALVDEPSAERLAAQIEALLARDDFPAMRERAVSIATDHYSWNAVAQRWRTELQSAAKQRRHRAV